MSSSFLIKKAYRVLTMNPYSRQLEDQDILIQDGIIREIRPEIPLRNEWQILDGRDYLVFPGLINTHHHFFQNLTRALPGAQNARLFAWLRYHYPIWRYITREDILWSSRIAIAELLLSGCSTTVDHLYLFPGVETTDFIDLEIQVAREMGIRFHPTRGSMTVGESKGGLPPDAIIEDEGLVLREYERVLKTYHDSSPESMLQIILAPCAPFSVSKELMRKTARFAVANNLVLHTHLAETRDEEQYCWQKYGTSPFDFMEQNGWINSHAYFAHSIYLKRDEIEKMGASGAGVSTCPSSNMRLGSGIAPLKEFLMASVPVSIGVDGSASNDQGNMLLEMRQTLLLSRLRQPEFWLTPEEVWKMATVGGADVLGRDRLGRVEKGMLADLVMVNRKKLSLSGAEKDLFAGLILAFPSSPVDYLFINGRLIVEKGRIKGFNLEEAIEKHGHRSRFLLERAAGDSGKDVRILKEERVI